MEVHQLWICHGEGCPHLDLARKRLDVLGSDDSNSLDPQWWSVWRCLRVAWRVRRYQIREWICCWARGFFVFYRLIEVRILKGPPPLTS
ncbi:hypothetical protein BDA96_01G340300 [Sorghum bicolor]|uniref:Uncharacterized protein n=2 Tax=Sorghum bicolor TaxID=4558 RepID=A0A921S2S6_SORBI|nr:hypothetical protein BDA96_01G340300 [Sorghum bicolor]KXG39031.1 hypothetical protein SORBI_3001G317500 [Sorghum bicolor]